MFDTGNLCGQDAPRLLPRDRNRPLAAARIAVAQRDDFLLACVDLGEHDGRLVGLRAAGREEALLELAGGDLREFLGDGHLLDRRIHAGGVHEPGDLILQALHELGVRMPDPRGENPAEEIEVLAAVQILHGRAVRLRDDDGLGVVVGDAGE